MSENCHSDQTPKDVEDQPQSEEEILALRAHGGSIEARDALYALKQKTITRLGGRARKYLARLTWIYPETPLTEDDIEQQSFIYFCRLLEEWPPEESTFSRYLIKKLPSRLLHYVRDTVKPRRRAKPGESRPEETTEIEEWGQLPQNWQYYTADLSYRDRVTLTLRYWDDLPASRIADIRGNSKRTVNRDLRRARDTIRRKIEQDGEDIERKT